MPVMWDDEVAEVRIRKRIASEIQGLVGWQSAVLRAQHDEGDCYGYDVSMQIYIIPAWRPLFPVATSQGKARPSHHGLHRPQAGCLSPAPAPRLAPCIAPSSATCPISSGSMAAPAQRRIDRAFCLQKRTPGKANYRRCCCCGEIAIFAIPIGL